MDEPVGFEEYVNTSGVGSGQERSMFADRQGSVIWVTDPATGTVDAAYEYDGYGQITQTQGTLSQPYGYTGREYDAESGLYHYRARAYDPAAGVFVQADPIGFWSGSANIYGYVEGNPANHLDPSGMNATLDAFKLGGTGGLSLMALFAPLNEDGDTLAGGILGVAASIYKELDAMRIAQSLDTDAVNVAPNGKDPCEGLRTQIQEHQQKLVEYLSSPFAGDNHGLLSNSTNPLMTISIIFGRVAKLVGHIEQFKKDLYQCERNNGMR